VENFSKNSWSQLKDPTHFSILSMKKKEMDKPENKEAIKDLAEGKKTDAVAEFLKTIAHSFMLWFFIWKAFSYIERYI
jgi:hypothetical protein